MRLRPARALALAAGLALSCAAAGARADDQQQQRAEELFDEGRKLMRSRATLDQACRTLQESLTLWDRGDTMLNLALCHRLQGKTATAWTEFDKALSHGVKVRFPEAIAEAKKQRSELAAILSKLTVTVPPATAAIEGLTVELDGKPLPREVWNTAFVIDPGPVHVEARAAGYKPFDVRIEIGKEKDVKTVVVVLERAPAPPPPPPPPPPPSVAKTSRPVWPWIVGGAGLALGAGAIVAEVISQSAHRELDRKCGDDRRACMPGYDFTSARNRELVGFGLFVGLGTGGILALGAAGVGIGLSSKGQNAQKPSTSLVLSPTMISVESSF
ncbi:MAG: tetratricopeptide repeat protein [Minicystis sp.]